MRGFLHRHRGALICIAGVALLRAVFVCTTRADPVFRVPYLDGAFYHTWARSLAAGQGDFRGPYFLAPLYPHCLSWLYRLFGPDPFVVRAAQSLLGVVDAALVLVLGQRLFGRMAGFAAAALFGLEGCLVFHESLLGLEPLLLTLLLGGFVLLVPKPAGAAGPQSVRAAAAEMVRPAGVASGIVRAAVAGILLGLATLARATALLVAPVAGAMLARNGGRRALVACTTAWLVVLLPVLIRNHHAGAGFVLTTNAGVNFFAGNGPGANGRFRQPPGVQFFTSPLAHVAPESAALPSAVAPRPLTVEAVAGTAAAADSRAWFARSWDWIGTHTGTFAGLLLRKVGLVLQAREIPQIESYEFQRARLPMLWLFFVDLGWILPLAGLGMWCAWRDRRPRRGAVLGFGVATLLPCVLFFVTARHRLPALPYLALFAGAGAAGLAGWVAARRFTPAVVALLLLVAGAALTRVDARPPRTLPGWQHAQLAERRYALGDLDGAIREQEQAATVLPDRPEVQVNLALYWSERSAAGDLERAETLLRAVLAHSPEQPFVLFNLGAILEQSGKSTEAAAAYRRTLQLDPNFGPARARLQTLAPGGS